MATFTPNLNLQKPASPEQLDVAVLNNNWDKIDNAYGVAIGVRYYKNAADVVNATTTPATVVTFPVKANKIYLVSVDLFVTATSTGTVMQAKFLYSGGSTEDTSVAQGGFITVVGAVTATVFSSTLFTIGQVPVANTIYPAKGTYFIKSTGDGNVSLQIAPTTAASMTAKADSVVKVEQVA